MNDKSHLIWEQERMERKRIERRMKRANIWAKPYSYRDIDWYPNNNPRKANFNHEKVPERSNMWHFSHSSSVPLLTPTSKSTSAASTKSKKSQRSDFSKKFDPNEGRAKRIHDINNIFHQSSYQNLLKGGDKSVHAPIAYSSFNKENGRAFMTPIDNKYDNQSSVLQGRAKNFFSSQIF